MSWRKALNRDTRRLLERVGRTLQQDVAALEQLDAEERCWRESARSRGYLLALVQASGLSHGLDDAMRMLIEARQPNARFVAFQRELIDQLASCYGH